MSASTAAASLRTLGPRLHFARAPCATSFRLSLRVASPRLTSPLSHLPQRTWPRTTTALRAFTTTRTLFNSAPSSKPPSPLKKILPTVKHEQVFNVPNILTFGRLFSAPLIGYLILTSQPVAALSLFAISSATDVLDGWIARRWNLQTVVGSVIDPMADKALMTVLVVSLASTGALPMWLAALILGRDVGLAGWAIWWRWISLPPPKTMGRYWDFSLPSAEVRPTNVSKANTALQLALVGWCMARPLVEGGEGLEMAFEGLKGVVAGTTVWSGASYVFSKDAVKVLKHDVDAKVAADEKVAAAEKNKKEGQGRE